MAEENPDNPRQSQGALPASMATASKGLVSVSVPNMGQAMYQRYYPAAYAVDYMQQAVVAAEANPYVDVANTLAIEVQGLQARADARADALMAAQTKALAAKAKVNAARLKGARSGVKDLDYLKFVLDVVRQTSDIDDTQDQLRLERADLGGQGDFLAQIDSYGSADALTSSAKAGMEEIAGVLRKKSSTSASSEQIQKIAKAQGNAGAALRAIQFSDDEFERGSAARALAERLERDGMSAGQAAQFAGDFYKVGAGFATAGGQKRIQTEVRSSVQEGVIAAGAGEEDLATQRRLAMELARTALGRLGKGGGAFAAEQARQASKQLSAEEEANLDKYIAALQNDGMINEEGERVTVSGREIQLTAEDIAAGKDAYDKAKRNQTFRPDLAKWFDDEFLKDHANVVERGAEAQAAKAQAVGRAGRTPQQVALEASEMFVQSATALRDLEDYVPLSANINNNYDAKVVGGASHIARREGKQVFDVGARHPDRSRRLGGKSALRTGPLREALKAYELAGGSENAVADPEKLRQAVDGLKKKYRKNPDKAMIATQYLFAMQFVNEKQQKGIDTSPTQREDDGPPAPPPVNPPAPTNIGTGRDVADREAGLSFMDPAASSRAAAASAATPSAPPVGSVTPEELDNFLKARQLQAFLDGTYVRPEGEVTATTFSAPITGETIVDQYGGTDALGMGRDFSATDIRTGEPLQRLESPSGYGPGPLDNFANIGMAANSGNQQGAAVKTNEELMQSRFVSRFQNRPPRAAVVADAPPSASVSATADLFIDGLGNTVDAFGNIVDEQAIAAQQRAAERAMAITARGTRR